MKLLEFKRVNSLAILPSRGSEFAAGLDLYSVNKTRIKSGERVLIHTGLSVAIPNGYYGRIAPRSGLAIKYGIDVLAGVIDSDFRGEIICALINLGQNDFIVEVGNKIAQLIVEKIAILEPIWVEKLEMTIRDINGFGSTG